MRLRARGPLARLACMHTRLRLAGTVLLLLVWLVPTSADAGGAVAYPGCTFNGIRLWGKVKVVDHFPDIKVKVVDHFADVHVKKVEHFPDACGKWQLVEHFPDFKIQYVEHFPDVKVKFVDHFPGKP